MSNLAELIKKSVSLLEVAQRRLPDLKETGLGIWLANCPFPEHSETKPSFRLDANKQTFHCFGCGEHGDVINFVSLLDGLTLKEAMLKLAEENKVSLPGQSHAQVKSKDYFGACEALANLYAANLSAPGSIAMKYLTDRGIREDTIRAFRIGYCESDYDYPGLFEKEKIPLEKVKFWGLLDVSPKSNRLYNPLWERIIFPIRLPGQNRILSFGGRTITDNIAKYKMLTNNDFFQKGEHLFALDQASASIRKFKKANLVEGFFDAIAMHQAEFSNTVASLGTGITAHQLMALKQYTTHVVFLCDGDEAGQKAARNGVVIALRFGFKTQVAQLRPGSDPDSILNEDGGVKCIREVLDAAPDGLEYCLEWHMSNSAPIDLASWIEQLLEKTENETVKYILKKRIDMFLQT